MTSAIPHNGPEKPEFEHFPGFKQKRGYTL